MITKQGSKSIPVKVDPDIDINTIPLSKYRKLFPAHFAKAGNLKQKSLHPTRHTQTAHNTPQQFLGFFNGRHSLQDQTRNPTSKILCFQGHYKPKDTSIICCIRKVRHCKIPKTQCSSINSLRND